MILRYLSHLLRPTDTFYRILKIKRQNKKYATALGHVKSALDSIEVEIIMKLEPGARKKFQEAYDAFNKCL